MTSFLVVFGGFCTTDFLQQVTSPCALRVPRVRAPHTIRRETDGEGGAAAAAQRARGARDGGAEQRPLARCRCSVCQPETRALPLHARLLPCPVTRRALARPPHRARSARLLAAAAARPRAATLAPTLPDARGEVGGACRGRRALPRLRRGKA